MSEGIWVYVFLIFCGMWFAVILIGIGVVISGRKAGNQNIDTDIRDRCSDLHVDRGNHACMCGGVVGDNHRQECDRCDMESMGEAKKYIPNKEEMRIVLEYCRLKATNYERKVLGAVLEMIGRKEDGR